MNSILLKVYRFSYSFASPSLHWMLVGTDILESSSELNTGLDLGQRSSHLSALYTERAVVFK
jgi:hypothetical protein